MTQQQIIKPNKKRKKIKLSSLVNFYLKISWKNKLSLFIKELGTRANGNRGKISLPNPHIHRSRMKKFTVFIQR